MADKFRTDIDWDDVRVFLAISRNGSLSGAARELGINHATVSRRLAALERRIGVSLVEKRRDGFVVTAAGSLALDQASAMENAAEGFKRTARATDEIEGPVRISSTGTFGERLLVPILCDLANEHPALMLELAAEDRNVSLSRGDADIAVRLGRPASGDALARRLGVIRYDLCAAPSYLGRTPPGQRRLIGFDDETAQAAPGAQVIERLSGGVPIALRCPTISAQMYAALAGAGIALLPRFLTINEPNLVLVDPFQPASWQQEVWLLIRTDVKRVRRIRVVSDRIASLLSQVLRRSDRQEGLRKIE